MFEVWDGDVCLLFVTGDKDEADMLYEQGFKIKRIF